MTTPLSCSKHRWREMTNHGNLMQAARSALDMAMEQSSDVYVLGEDVVDGGPFALTRGLAKRHGTDRVLNTPISEGAFMGAGIGLALAGARPFVDIMFNDFITAASDQLFNNAAKIHVRSGGRRSLPLTTWTLAGAGTRWAAHHSQHLDGWFAQVPGLKVLSPASPAMMFASVSAALADPDPVVLLVDRALLYTTEPLAHDDASPWRPRIVRAGEDVTLVASGRLVHLALAATQDMDASVEVIDLQRLAPLDVQPVLESVRKTKRLVIAHDEVSNGAFAAMLQAAIYPEAFWILDEPIAVVSSSPTPVPAAPNLEDAFMVGRDEIARAIEGLVG
jgi:pyruvate/2-oxoglutarate/acetoin dehydrogenase E1 component